MMGKIAQIERIVQDTLDDITALKKRQMDKELTLVAFDRGRQDAMIMGFVKIRDLLGMGPEQ